MTADDPVTHIVTPEVKPTSVAATRVKEAESQADARPVKVKVQAPFRVIHAAKAYSDGDVVEVPPDVAEIWKTRGWAKPTTAKPRTKEK